MDANIGGTIADDDAIIYTIASNQVNAIRFMTSTRTLIIGTAGGEFTVSGGSVDTAITVTKWTTFVDHVKNNRIEYLLCMGILHLVGITNKAYAQVSGVCI